MYRYSGIMYLRTLLIHIYNTFAPISKFGSLQPNRAASPSRGTPRSMKTSPFLAIYVPRMFFHPPILLIALALFIRICMLVTRHMFPCNSTTASAHCDHTYKCTHLTLWALRDNFWWPLVSSVIIGALSGPDFTSWCTYVIF